jgi:hypothetical protein
MIKRFQFLAGFLFIISGTSGGVFAAPNNHNLEVATVILEQGPIGVWEYEVEGTEDAYKKGVLFVRLENGTPIVEVHLGNGVLNGQDIQLQGDTLKFIVNLDGVERVAIVLKSTGDTIIGEASSGQGSFRIKGTRKSPPR